MHCGRSPQDKAKVKIRKLNDPPKAEAVRDMVRYARNVIEEFRRAKHYKYILGGCGECLREVLERWEREQRMGRRCWMSEEDCPPVNGRRLTHHP